MSAQPDAVGDTGAHDSDAQETREWLDALSGVIQAAGPQRAHFLLEQLIEQARQSGIDLPFSANTDYVNTIKPEGEERSPGNLELEGRLRAYVRWNAMALVVKANRLDPADGGDLGGHISSFASVAHMFADGFNHFWYADDGVHGGDLLYIQGHSSPGIYARAFLEGRLTEDQLLNFRQEVGGKGLSSYPHPKLMPEFWQFPTVSMGLGPHMAIYQARFLKYLHARGIADTSKRKVWAFCGDGEMDEPESLGAIGLASREKLDNLVFVVNCNLQRLDGPVRGNGKIIQELEGKFRGSGWNVIKLIWGSNWDPLLARDKDGALRKIMMDTLDGDYQAFKANDGAFLRKNFFGRDPRTLKMVAKMSDGEIWALRRGGLDAQKVYAAFHRAQHAVSQPTVLLVKTVKGWGMGEAAEGKNTAHQTPRVKLLGSGTILRESQAAKKLLEADWGVAANVWSCPSFNELTREGQDCERWNLLHPTAEPRVPFVAQQLGAHAGPVVAATDYMKNYAEQIRAYIPKGRAYRVLGTDGFGRSDFRSKLREHFEVNRHYIVVAALKALTDDGALPAAKVAEAIKKYRIDTECVNPLVA